MLKPDEMAMLLDSINPGRPTARVTERFFELMYSTGALAGGTAWTA